MEKDPLLFAFEVAFKKRLDPTKWAVGTQNKDTIWTVAQPKDGLYESLIICRIIKENGNEWSVVSLTIEHQKNMILFNSPLMPNSQLAKGYEYDTPDFDPDKFVDECIDWVIAEYVQPTIK